MNIRRYLALALVSFVSLSLVPGAPGTAAAKTDPLVADSLTALNALVSGDNCADQDASDGDAENGIDIPFTLCDDGFASAGTNGIPTPVAYHPSASGNDFSALPAPATDEEATAADGKYDLRPDEGNRITLDVDVSLPTTPAPKGGRPVMVFMHGCCGGNRKSWEATTIDGANELWHNSNAFFASRGYVVLNYTARGFRNSSGDGSTGTTQLDSRRFEVNDYQYLVGLMADDDADKRAKGDDPIFSINPKKIAVNGGSYGAGFSWLALTDPTWKSPKHHVPLRLAAAVPKYGWTDLVESLVPSGHYKDRDPEDPTKSAIAPSKVAGALSAHPIGVEKQSTVTGLYATGQNEADNHTTFPDYMDTTYQRLQQGEPYNDDPDVEATLKGFLEDRSAYFQNRFWSRVKHGLRVPIYVAATWTDPLFPTMESVRFYNKLKSIAPDYPVTMYLGDYQHLYAQNKAKEWDSLCGDDHHICALDDYRKGGRIRIAHAKNEVRAGVLARINKFFNFFLKGRGSKPAADVSATTTICSSNATDKYPADEPGIEYRASTWRALAPKVLDFGWTDGMTSNAAPDTNAVESDPVARNRQAEKCFITDQQNPPIGVVTATTEPLDKTITMMGVPWVDLDYTADGDDYWIAARLYDQDAGGTMTMVTRGVCRVNATSDPDVDCKNFDLWGNGWTFEKDHTIVIEVTESDTPTFRKDNNPSTITIKSIGLHVPTTKNSLKVDFRG
ncbi:MAG: type transport system ATP-binding protein [Actinomycetota bacterium]|nr:type transport system ATP-binding protein [Actinomycetota bacterium]